MWTSIARCGVAAGLGLLAATLVHPPGANASRTVMLRPALSCEINSYGPACGQGYPQVGHFLNWPYTRYRALMRFDLAQIPAGAQIISAAVATNWYWPDDNGASVWIDVHEVSAPFTSAASWTHRDATATWTTPGGDYVAQAAATGQAANLGWNPEVGVWDITPLARDWYTGAKPNRGLLFRSPEIDSDWLARFNVVELEDTQLYVTYVEPDAASPHVDVDGELVDLAEDYVNGLTSVRAVVAADDDASGIAHLGVSEVGGAELGGVEVDCGTPRDCPTDVDAAVAVSLTGLPAGRHVLHGTARDDSGKVGVSDSFVIYVDREAPGPATDFDAVKLDGEPVDLSWAEADDPDLPDGTPGSGTTDFSYRFRLNLGSWTEWTQTDDPGVDLPQAAVGDRIDVEVKTIDAAANTGPVAAATVTVTADDGSAESGGADDEGSPSAARESEQATPPDDPPEPGSNFPAIAFWCNWGGIDVGHTTFGNGKFDVQNAVGARGKIRCWNNAKTQSDIARVPFARLTLKICVHVWEPGFAAGKLIKCRKTTARAPAHPDPLVGRDTRIRPPRGLCEAGNRYYELHYTARFRRIRQVTPRVPPPKTMNYTIDCNEAGAWRYLAVRGGSFELGLNIDGSGALTTPARCDGAFCDDLPAHGTSATRRGWAAHHVVPGGEGRNRERNTTPEATRAQTYAYACGQHPNRPPNGAWLRGSDLRKPKGGWQNLRGTELDRPNHDNIHQIVYYQEVADRLAPYVYSDDTCKTADGKPLVDELQKIKREVIFGQFSGLPAASRQP